MSIDEKTLTLWSGFCSCKLNYFGTIINQYKIFMSSTSIPYFDRLNERSKGGREVGSFSNYQLPQASQSSGLSIEHATSACASSSDFAVGSATTFLSIVNLIASVAAFVLK